LSWRTSSLGSICSSLDRIESIVLLFGFFIGEIMGDQVSSKEKKQKSEEIEMAEPN